MSKAGADVSEADTLKLNRLTGRLRKARRIGHGSSARRGDTCGRGQKGQRSRAGSGRRPGFEGGQMPLQRRLPKFGFHSRKPKVFEVRLDALNKLEGDTVDREALIKAGVIPARSVRVKLIRSGELTRAVTVKGCSVTAGARRAVEEAGGRVE